MRIELRKVTKRFGSFTALENINLAIGEGELVALLGPSGSGKTTLLRTLAGLETPDPNPETVVKFDDPSAAAENERHKVGFVFQHYALFRNMTVFENIAFGLRVLPRHRRPDKKAIENRVKELLELIQLEPLANRYPSQLSGGQRQRVALARALAVEPKVLLLDEPFGALDAKVRKELRSQLRQLHERIPVTTILVTHDQDEALEVASRIVVMNKGKIEQDGTPVEVFQHPATPFVADFLGDVNLFRGRIEDGKARIGPFALDLPSGIPLDARSARIFVRPHQFEVDREIADRPSMRARILRIQPAGSLVKLEVRNEVGEVLNAEISHDRHASLGLGVGDEIFVSLRDARIFVDDFSI